MKEAKYRLDRLKKVQEIPEHFQYELNAFLASARSVQIYACEEAKKEAKAGNRQSLIWYEKAASKHSIFKKMSTKRNITIHEEPIEPQVSKTVSASVASTFIVFDETGVAPSPLPPQLGPPQPKATYRYRFQGSPPRELVLDLCEQYLTELEAFVNDGVQKGHIKG